MTESSCLCFSNLSKQTRSKVWPPGKKELEMLPSFWCCGGACHAHDQVKLGTARQSPGNCGSCAYPRTTIVPIKFSSRSCLTPPLWLSRFGTRISAHTRLNAQLLRYSMPLFCQPMQNAVNCLKNQLSYNSLVLHFLCAAWYDMLHLLQSNEREQDNAKAACTLMHFGLNLCDDKNKQALCKQIIHHASILLKSLSLIKRGWGGHWDVWSMDLNLRQKWRPFWIIRGVSNIQCIDTPWHIFFALLPKATTLPNESIALFFSRS